MMYNLPTTISINNKEYKINTDYRVCLSCICIMEDIEIPLDVKVAKILDKMFIDEKPSDFNEAIKEIFNFLTMYENKENEETKTTKKTIDYYKDEKLIVHGINKMLKCDIRSVDYMHLWTFLGYMQELDDCMFTSVLRIRQKLNKGEKLTKDEKEWRKNNRRIVDLNYIDIDSDDVLEFFKGTF